MRLHGAHDNILAAFAAAPGFIQHAERFSDAGRVTQDNLKVASTRDRLLLGFHFTQALFGRAPAEFTWHLVRLPTETRNEIDRYPSSTPRPLPCAFFASKPPQ